MDLCNTRSYIFRRAVDQPCYRGPPSFMYKTVCESVCGGKTSAYERSICKKNIFAVCSYFLSVKAIMFKFSTEKILYSVCEKSCVQKHRCQKDAVCSYARLGVKSSLRKSVCGVRASSCPSVCV